MDLTIHLTPDEEDAIRVAKERGADVESKLREVIHALEVSDARASDHLNGSSGPFHSSTARLLQSWIDEGDEEEQRETFTALKEGLNTNHSSSRRIFSLAGLTCLGIWKAVGCTCDVAHGVTP